MNLLGKILVVTLFVLSMGYMWLAISVYSYHRDWKTTAETAQKQLNDERARFQALQNKSNALESQLKAEAESALQQVRKLETETTRLAEANQRITLQINELNTDARQAVEAVTATQQNNNHLAQEVSRIRDDISKAIKEKDDSFDVALKATEELQSIRNDLESALETQRDLVADTGRMTRVMESEGLDPNAPADGITPRVDGFVSRTQRKGGVQLVEISIGDDDGLRIGDTVEVFRDTKYKGRLEILKTAPDRAVGRVDTRFQQGPIQEGDRVATRLNLN
jgi:multidrug efflux pump subunit AcrA (membrane-fusion protein)